MFTLQYMYTAGNQVNWWGGGVLRGIYSLFYNGFLNFLTIVSIEFKLLSTMKYY